MADDSRWYTTAPSTLTKVLTAIPGLGTPTRVDSAWLASIGHGGGNNQSVLRVLRNVGLIGDDRAPSDLWPAFKGGDKTALADGIRGGYAELFAIYPDAYRKDAEALRSFFRSNTGLGDKGQAQCVATFQNLVAAADFSGESSTPGAVQRAGTSGRDQQSVVRSSTGSSRAMTRGAVGLTVNIQLQLPPSSDGEVYDKLFEAMAKHLQGLIRTE